MLYEVITPRRAGLLRPAACLRPPAGRATAQPTAAGEGVRGGLPTFRLQAEGGFSGGGDLGAPQESRALGKIGGESPFSPHGGKDRKENLIDYSVDRPGHHGKS